MIATCMMNTPVKTLDSRTGQNPVQCESVADDAPGLTGSRLRLSLRRFETICMHCKRVKSSEGRWIEPVVTKEEVECPVLSHGICSDCVRKYYPYWEI